MQRPGLTVGILILTLASTAAVAQPPPPIERLIREGRLDAAEQQLRQRLAARDDPADRYLLGFTLIALYRYREAESELRRAVTAQPHEHAWIHALAKAELEQNKNLSAIATLERAIALAPRPEYRFALAMCALNVGAFDRAQRELRAVVAEQPGNAEALYRLGKLLADDGERDAALGLLRRALAADPEHLEARFQVGLAERRAGNTAAAIAALEAVLARVPGHVGALYNLGAALIGAGRDEEGRARLDELARMSALDDEITFLEESLRKEPDNLGGRMLMAQKLLAAGRSTEAVDQLLVARRLAPERVEIYRRLAEAYRRLGRAELAERAERFAASLEGRSP